MQTMGVIEIEKYLKYYSSKSKRKVLLSSLLIFKDMEAEDNIK
jgi:hypothetical protein